MSDKQSFVFIEPRQNYAMHLGAVVVQNVKDMVARVIFELAQSGGKIGKITFESQASWSGNNPGYFYIGLDEINHLTIKQHARDLIELAPHFAPDAKVTIYGPCGSAFNAMATYMLSNFWPGVSVTTENAACGRPMGYRSGHGSHHRYGHSERGRYGYGNGYGGHYHGGGHGHRH